MNRSRLKFSPILFPLFVSRKRLKNGLGSAKVIEIYWQILVFNLIVSWFSGEYYGSY